VKDLSAKPQPATPAASGATPPDGFRQTCDLCHDDDVIRQQRLTRAGWDREITKMTGWGAKVTDSQRSALLDYLFANFGPR
jgi:cytochrome c5